MFKKMLLVYLKGVRGLTSPSKIIDFSFRRHKNKTCIIDPDRNETLTFKDLQGQVGRIVFFLREKNNLKEGETVGFIAGNCREYFLIRSAAHSAGFVFFIVPPYLEPQEIIGLLGKAGVKVLFYRQSDVPGIAGMLGNAGFPAIDIDGKDYSDIFTQTAGLMPGGCLPERIATLNLSSATTNKTPKIIQLTGFNWVESLYNLLINSDVSFGKKIVLLCSLPYSTAGSTSFLPSLLSGAENVIIREPFNPEKVADLVKRFKVTHLYITPSRLLELLEYCRRNEDRLAGLDNIITGTERIAPAMLKAAILFFGPKISVGYGMVEVLPPVTMLSPKDYDRPDISDKIFASVGRVSEGVSVKILSPDHQPAAPGRIGKIAIKSNTMARGYLAASREEQDSFKGGWFYTADYGFFDEEGFLYISGREQDILTRDPFVFAGNLEDKLYSLGFIKQCAIISSAGRIIVVVSLRHKMDGGEAQGKILEFCGKNFDKRFLPGEIIIKDVLPVSPAGKLDKKELSRAI
jgi:acyl-CoA synthetase (AMP-forming)/AMP-acid ligase II